MMELEKNIEAYLDKLTKEVIADFVGLTEKETKRMKKEELVKMMKRKTRNSKKAKKEILKMYEEFFSLYPSTVEEELGITKTERKRWTEENKLNVIGYESFNKWGKTITYPLYSAYQIVQLTEKDLKKWRDEHKKNVAKNRKTAVKKTMQTKKENTNKQKHFYEKELKKMKESWDMLDGIESTTMEFAFWTVWMNRWAKENQIKQSRAIKKASEYAEKKEMLYKMKNEAMRLLKHSPLAEVTFYRPESADRISNIVLCGRHYEDWHYQRQDWYLPIWEYFEYNKKAIKNCKTCTFQEKKDYYSLYYLHIKDERLPEYSYSFHIPNDLGEDFLPNKETLKKVVHEEQEGAFRFGRAVEDEEKIIFSEKKVIEYFEQAKEKFEEELHISIY